MKKAQANKMLYIVLSLAALVIIILTITGLGKSLYEKAFGEKGAVQPITTEEEAAIIRGTVKKGVATQTITLPSQRDIAIEQLGSEIVRCWNYMKTGKMDSYRHANIIIPRYTPGITQKELVNQVIKWNTDAADVLNSDWKEPYDKGNILVPGTYLLCCDYDSLLDSDIYLTTDITFDCE